MNLRVAASSEGFGVRVRLFTKPEEPDLLARVSFSEQLNASAEDAQLASFIESRRTHGKRFEPREVSASALEHLIDAEKREDARLVPLLSEEARRQAAGLVAEGDAAH